LISTHKKEDILAKLRGTPWYKLRDLLL